MDVLLWYGEITWDYIKQMLPCAAGAAAVFFCLLPWRRKRLSAKMLRSLPIRETALLLFVLFCAGLAALTLFPSNFWGSLLNRRCRPSHRLIMAFIPKSIFWMCWRLGGAGRCSCCWEM